MFSTLFGSKKFVVVLIGCLIEAFSKTLGIETGSAHAIAGLAGTYAIGQGLADFSKEKKTPS